MTGIRGLIKDFRTLFVQGYGFEDIAVKTGVPASTVRSQFQAWGQDGTLAQLEAVRTKAWQIKRAWWRS